MMVLGGGAFEMCLGFESEAFIHEISILKKETLKSSLAPSTIWGNRMKVPAMNQEEGRDRVTPDSTHSSIKHGIRSSMVAQ